MLCALRFMLCALRFLSISVYAIQIFESSLQTTDKTFFSFAKPHTWIIKLLIRFFCTFGIAQLRLKVRLVLFVILMNTVPECPLQIGIQIHFNSAVSDGFTNLILR